MKAEKTSWTFPRKVTRSNSLALRALHNQTQANKGGLFKLRPNCGRTPMPMFLPSRWSRLFFSAVRSPFTLSSVCSGPSLFHSSICCQRLHLMLTHQSLRSSPNLDHRSQLPWRGRSDTLSASHQTIIEYPHNEAPLMYALNSF